MLRSYDSLPRSSIGVGLDANADVGADADARAALEAGREGPGGIHMAISQFKKDIGWARRQSTVPFTACVKGSASGEQSDCVVPLNKGGEASAYLAFILRYWNNLPAWVAFVDPNERSWHQPFDKVAKIACVGALLGRGERVSTSGYLGLNELRIVSDSLRDWSYKDVFDSVVGPWLGECPAHLVTDGSGQFLVSREAILRQPRALYECILAYCLGFRRFPGDTAWLDAVKVSYAPGRKGKDNSYFTEYIWHMLFGEKAVLDTNVQYQVCTMRPPKSAL